MMKKVVAAIILSALTASAIPVSAYDENGAMNYLENCAKKYSSAEELEKDSTDILTELKDKYQCETKEAEELYNTLAEKLKKKNDDNSDDGNKSDGTDEKDGTNGGKDDVKKPNDGDNTVLKKNTSLKTDVLSQLGVLDKNGFDFFGNVTRGNFAVYIANLVNFGQDYSKEKGYYSFKDVTSEDECYHAVASLINLYSVSGVGEGIFAPNDNITLSQACSILMRVLGYEAPEAQQDNGELYYYQKAVNNGITKGVSKGSGECISGEDAVILLYNILEAKCVNSFGNDSYAFGKGFLEYYLNLETVKGVVTSNSLTSLYSGDGAVSKGYLNIDEVLYNFGDLKTTGELDGLLGKRVSVYRSIDEPDSGKVIVPLDDYNEYLNIKSSEIERYDEKENRLYYIKDAKVYHEDISMNTKLIFNGVAVDYPHDNKLMLEPDSGEITFIKNDRGAAWNVIVIDSYVYYESARINASNPVLNDNLRIQPDIELDGDKVTAFKDGEEIDPSTLPSGAIIMAAPSRVTYENGVMHPDTENSKHIRLEAAGSEVSGKVTGMGADAIKIEGSEYTFSKTLTKLNKTEQDNKYFKIPSVGSAVSAELDKYGEIICFKVSSYSDSVQYGYVVKLSYDEENDNYRVKLFTQDGQMINAKLKDKVKVHRRWEDGTLSENTYYAKRIEAGKLAVIDSGAFNPQVVKYSLSGADEIGELYLADATYKKTSPSEVGKEDRDFYVADKDIFELDYSCVNGGTQYWELIYWYNVSEGNSNGVYLMIPTDPSAADDDYKAYKTTITALPNGYWSNMEFYDVGETGNVGLVVKYVGKSGKTGKLENTSNAVVAEAPEPIYDEKTDEISYKIKLYATKRISRIWTQGAFAEYTFADSEMVSFTISDDSYASFKKLSNIPITSLKPGDLLKISIDSESGKISGFCVLANDIGEIDPETGKPEMGAFLPVMSVTGTKVTESTGHSVWQTTNITKGFVEKCVGSSTFFVRDGSGYLRKLTIGDNTYSRDKVVIYDKAARKNKITEATPADVRVGDYVVSAFDETLIIVRNYN